MNTVLVVYHHVHRLSYQGEKSINQCLRDLLITKNGHGGKSSRLSADRNCGNSSPCGCENQEASFFMDTPACRRVCLFLSLMIVGILTLAF